MTRAHTRWGPSGPAVLGLALLLTTAAPAHAKLQLGIENWGLGGSAREGAWSVLYLELKSTGEDFTGILEVNVVGGQRCRPVFVKPIELVKDTMTRHWVYFRTPVAVYEAPRFSWVVRRRNGRAVLQNRWPNPVHVGPEHTQVVVLRSADVAAAGLGALHDRESKVRTYVRYHAPAMAPDRTVGYEGADVLVWINPEPERFVSPAQGEALAAYVRRGGHLVVAAGSGWQALARSFLADLLPATPIGSTLEPDGLAALRDFGLPDGAPKQIVLMRLKDPRGRVLVDRAGQPVILRGRAGLGAVTLIAFDPTKSPFIDVPNKKDFWQTVLQVDAGGQTDAEVGNLATPYGTYQAASRPLLRTLDEFPGFKPINFALVGIFLVVYVVVIGPVDYFVLKHFKRLHWTWVTFPSIAILSSVLAFVLLSSGRVVGLLANSVSLVDASVDDDHIAGTTFMTVLSPRQTRYDVGLRDVTSGWLTPRDVMLSRGGGLGMDQSTCAVLNAGHDIRNMLIRVWDAQTMEAGWRVPAPDLPAVRLARAADGLTGTITNDTADSMDGVQVLYGDRLYTVGALPAGQSKSVNGSRWVTLSSRAKDLLPAEFQGYDFNFTMWGDPEQRIYTRDDARAYARWLSLFSAAGGRLDGRLRRCLSRTEARESVAFDLPARAQLTGLGSRDEAVVLYGVQRRFVDIELSGWTPDCWDWSLVRLRVPVTAPAAPEGDPE